MITFPKKVIIPSATDKQLTFPIGVVNGERRQLSVKLLLTKYLRIILAEDNLG